jgi:5-methylcytosine-specific restriction endonuclease McrA
VNQRDRFAKRQEAFEGWLLARGAEVLAPTNEWEMLRFRTGRGVSIVYRKGNGSLTFTGEAAVAYDGYRNANGKNASWRGTERTTRRTKSTPTCLALRQRDGDACFFCHREVSIDDESVEHLVAVTHGGPDHIANMALAHRTCNDAAGHLSLMDKIRMREENWRRLHTPGTLPNLLLAESEPVLGTTEVRGVLQLARAEMPEVDLGDFVWVKGLHGDVEIPPTRGQVIAADEGSVTVKVPADETTLPWRDQ